VNLCEALRIERGQKLFVDGTHRVVAPSETVARVWPNIADMGITRVANVTGLDEVGIPVIMVCRPNSKSIAVSQGKGVSLAAAEASGLMESIETYHAENMELPLRLASYEELARRERVIDIGRLPAVENSLYRLDLPILWVQGFDLMNDVEVWLPYEIVHTDYTLPSPEGTGCFMASSNGLASGNHLLEAISHGICEVVERDATSLWDAMSDPAQDARRVDLATIGDPLCCEVIEKFEHVGIGIGVWDVTSDIGIPSFFCWIMERDNGTGADARSNIGAGCHPVREVALLRALTEAAQERLTAISGARDDLEWSDFTVAPDIQTARSAIIFERTPSRDFRHIQSHRRETVWDDIEWQLTRLRAVGVNEVVVVDLSKPDRFGFAVARVVIPGLEGLHDHPRYLPGPRAQALFEKAA
jgi:ribosomal protein S12 methylthiotransferase accessory factor